ncbi:MAG: universal stress protein [Syntrophobacteraceae bacterium]
MNDSVRDKILVACDGSEHSLATVRYVASILDQRRFEVVLFHVRTKFPESFIDHEKKTPAYNYRIVNVEAWEQREVKAICDFMEKAKAILLQAGFPEEAISLTIAERDIGIARDIAAESKNGYKALVVGRRGLSDFKDFMLGSVASNILGLVSIPVWIVGGKYLPKKFLLCLTDSEGAMLALSHVSEVLGASKDCEVMLLHAVRSFRGFRNFVREAFSSEGDKTEVERIERELDAAAKLLEPSFDKARAALVSSGVDTGRIHQKIISGASNAAQAIIDEAEKGGYDTIVVGRRGLSKVGQLIMGRVSNRVIHMAKDRTVWVVS